MSSAPAERGTEVPRGDGALALQAWVGPPQEGKAASLLPKGTPNEGPAVNRQGRRILSLMKTLLTLAVLLSLTLFDCSAKEPPKLVSIRRLDGKAITTGRSEIPRQKNRFRPGAYPTFSPTANFILVSSRCRQPAFTGLPCPMAQEISLLF